MRSNQYAVVKWLTVRYTQFCYSSLGALAGRNIIDNRYVEIACHLSEMVIKLDPSKRNELARYIKNTAARDNEAFNEWANMELQRLTCLEISEQMHANVPFVTLRLNLLESSEAFKPNEFFSFTSSFLSTYDFYPESDKARNLHSECTSESDLLTVLLMDAIEASRVEGLKWFHARLLA